MRPQAKREMAVITAGKIERIGVLKLFGIPVGRPEQKQQVVTLANVLPVQLEVDRCAAEGSLHR